MASPKPERSGSRSALFGTVGAAMEWYDFTLYVYLTPVISTLFFPADNPVDSLLATFGVFAAGYLMRPIGAAVLGNIGDTRGRKPAIAIAVSLMTVAMAAIALLPTESSIGALAPIGLVVLRLVQGFSLGGEFSGSIVLLGESAPPERRGMVINLVQIATGSGMLLSAGTATVLTAVLSDAQMDDFGWRLPFLLGALIGVFALFMLRKVEEPDRPGADSEEDPAKPVKMPAVEVFRSERGPLTRNFLLNGYQAFIYYVVATFIPTYLTTLLGAKPEEALFAATVAAFLFMALTPPAGLWSDHVGRRPVLYAGAGAMVLLAVPLFLLLAEVSIVPVLIAQVALIGIVSVFTAPAMVTATELFGDRTRYSGVAIGYNAGAAIFGGTAPLICTAVIQWAGTDLAPAFLLVAASLAILPVVLTTPETAPARQPARRGTS